MTSEDRAWFLIARSVSGDITPQEIEELELIFIAHPELRAGYDDIQRIKLNTSSTLSAEERQALERGLQKLEHSLAHEDRSMERLLFNNEPLPLYSRTSKWWMAAASILVLFVLGTFALRHFRTPQVTVTPQQQQLATHFGKRIHTVLPDGSLVWLNSGSTIKYADNLIVNGKREVTLNGEAYFDVKHDTIHPFIVHAGKMSVVVLGTAFNVRAYAGDDYMETTLIRGKVAVTNANKPGQNIVLYPNEKVVLATQSDVIQKSKLLVKNITAPDSISTENVTLPNESIIETGWVNNKLTFKNENFTDLARQLERWYNVEIVFDNDRYNLKEFNGTFKNQSIDDVMRALQIIYPFHYKLKNNQIHVW